MTTQMIGIDPGVSTGFAVWCRETRKLLRVETRLIHEAMADVRELRDAGLLHSVTFEDARQRRWFGAADKREDEHGAGVREGVGSVKRDCKVWEDYLTALGVKFVMRPPTRGATKWSAEYLKRLTKWKGRTSEHGRDAAALVYGK